MCVYIYVSVCVYISGCIRSRVRRETGRELLTAPQKAHYCQRRELAINYMEEGGESKIAYSYTLMRLISTPQFAAPYPLPRARPYKREREGKWKKIIKFVLSTPQTLKQRMPTAEKFNSF